MNDIKIAILIFFIMLSFACNRDPIDDQKPVIDMNGEDSFPNNCDTLYLGSSFTFRALFTDNVQLGSFSIDIHNNFDHHSHSTDVNECQLLPVKTPVNPFVFIKEYEIPAGLDEYQAVTEISIPENYDEGDYHFFVSLTDREGWRSVKGISLKILKNAKE